MKTKRQTYDLVFGVGAACSCSQSLRRARLQLLSFPGDWTAPIWGWHGPEQERHNLVLRVRRLCAGFDGFFDPADFRFVGPHEWNGKEIYANLRTHYVFNHDFTQGADFAAELPKVAERFRRRRDRLLALIRAARRALVVRLDFPNGDFPTAPDDCRLARELLTAAFPGTDFDILLLRCDPAVPFARRRVEPIGEGCLRLAFDYRDTKPGADPRIPDLALTAAALADLARVRDYRTRAERRAHRLRSNLKHWAKFGATTRWGYWRARLLGVLGRRVKPASGATR